MLLRSMTVVAELAGLGAPDRDDRLRPRPVRHRDSTYSSPVMILAKGRQWQYSSGVKLTRPIKSAAVQAGPTPPPAMKTRGRSVVSVEFNHENLARIHHKCSLCVRVYRRIGYKGGMNETHFMIGETPVHTGEALLGLARWRWC